jgi:hypothetical protein
VALAAVALAAVALAAVALVAAEAATTEAGAAVIVDPDAAEIEVVTVADAATVTDRAVGETQVPVLFVHPAPGQVQAPVHSLGQ